VILPMIIKFIIILFAFDDDPYIMGCSGGTSLP